LSGDRHMSLPTFPSISAGIDFAFSFEPVIDLPAWHKAALLRSAVGKVTDALVPFGRGQPVRNEKQRPDGACLCGRGSLRFSPWNPCGCNFARHIAPLRPAVTGFRKHGLNTELQQWIVAQCPVGIV
jgi:hypothetical protein